jgi:quinol monooxygenase YgiN
MVTRLVKMTFRPDAVETFLAVFREVRPRIRAVEGCTHLELWRDTADPAVFFTYSVWDGPEHLEAYRRSALFQATWPRTKVLFAAPAQAWTVEQAG